MKPLRLIDYQGLSQEACARQMEASRATIQALYAEARKKTARFLVEAPLPFYRGGSLKNSQEKAPLGSVENPGKNRV